MSYDHNRNPVYKTGNIIQDDNWRKKTHLEMFELNGNGWEWFTGVPFRHNRKQITWIEKFRKQRDMENE